MPNESKFLSLPFQYPVVFQDVFCYKKTNSVHLQDIHMPTAHSLPPLPDFKSLLSRSLPGWAAALIFAVGGALAAHVLDLSELQTAQISIGLFGLGGGLSHAVLIHHCGGHISPIRALSLSAIWGACCIGCVSPLFFTSGTALKMLILSFYSFAAFGAVGGFMTVSMMSLFFQITARSRTAPPIAAWSLSFGLAAVSGEMSAEFLRLFLPEYLVLLLAFTLVALIIACGSAYALTVFFHSPLAAKPDRRPSISENIPLVVSGRDYISLLLLLCVPFYLNDFSNIWIHNWRLWLFIDYTAVKLFPFLVLVWALRRGKITLSELGINRQTPASFWTVFLIAFLAAVFIDQNGPLFLNFLPGYAHLGVIPVIDNVSWRWIDLTFGLLMVGVFEEFVFRGYLYLFLSRYIRSPFLITILSALAFGLIHWSGGFIQVVVTACIGAVFMHLYIQTRSLPAVMLAHICVNFVDFADIVPKTLFRFF